MKARVPGTFHDTKNGVWRAWICSKGKRIWLGIFSTETDAITARLAAEKEYGKPKQGFDRLTNTYFVREGVVFMNISTPAHPNTWTQFDLRDLSKIVDGKGRWFAYQGSESKSPYAIRNKKKGSESIHRLVLGAKKGESVDHISGNTLDNLQSNLRIATVEQNNKNRSIGRNTSTGILGVDWVKGAERFRVRVGHNGKQIHIGVYKTLEEAAAARKHVESIYGYHPNHGRCDSGSNSGFLFEPADGRNGYPGPGPPE